MKVLFTTFTRNLAQTIEGQLIQLAGPSITYRVHVINLDALARSVVAATDSGRKFVNSSKVAAEYQLSRFGARPRSPRREVGTRDSSMTNGRKWFSATGSWTKPNIFVWHVAAGLNG